MKQIIVEHISLYLQMAIDINTHWEAFEKKRRTIRFCFGYTYYKNHRKETNANPEPEA